MLGLEGCIFYCNNLLNPVPVAEKSEENVQEVQISWADRLKRSFRDSIALFKRTIIVFVPSVIVIQLFIYQLGTAQHSY